MAMRPALRAGLPLVLASLLAPGSAAARPRVDEFGMAVRTAAVARTAAFGMRVTSAVLSPARRFDLVGLRWRGAGELEGGRLRTRVNGRWRRWVPLASAGDHGPDRGPLLKGTDAVWTGGAEALQLSWRSAPEGMRLRFVRVTHRVRMNAPRARASQAEAPPAMIARSQWDPGGQCPPRAAPQYGRVNMAFVHHTVSDTDYAAEASPSMVLAICRYHRNANGWNDIGYNFLVDKYGRLFEGRAGGIDRAVVGAQAQGWNSQSTSVSNIGTYSDVPQTDAGLAAMADLLSWKLGVHGVPVTGQVTLTSAGGSANRYPSGAQVTFERISGHRDGGKTECPGQALYEQLPQLRELAYQRGGETYDIAVPNGGAQPQGSVTLAALSTALLYPEPARLTGSLSGGGQVWVQVAAGPAYRTVARVDPAPDGRWSVELPLTRGHTLRALQVLSDGTHGAASGDVAVSLTPALTASAPRRVLAGRSVPLRGRIGPNEPTLTASLWIQDRRGRFAFVRRVAIRARSGRFGARLPVRRPGLYRVRTRFGGNRWTRPASAPDVYVRAVRNRRSLSGGAAGPGG
jgi:hypothetical protein